MELERQNPHWEEGYAYPYEKKRLLFEEVKKSAQSGMITAVYGMRRVGKSVMLKQLINHAIGRGTKRQDIFYFSFDENYDDFWGVIKEYERMSGGKIGKNSLLLFDEIQKVADWRSKLKLLYDSSGARIVISGSNSSGLRKGGESLAGRINEHYLPELSFREFLHFRDESAIYKSKLGERVENAFCEYLKRPFPELVFNKSLEPASYASTITRKVIFEDLPAVFPIDEPPLLFRLFSLICKNPGMIVEYSALSSDLGRNRKTISLYLEYLTFGFLAVQLYNYSKNALTSEKKQKKFYPSLAAFCESDESKMVETAVMQMLKPSFFWNYKNRFEVDFVLDKPLAGFEVKYKNSIGKDDWQGLRQFGRTYPKAKLRMVGRKEGKDSIPYFRLEQYLKK